MIETKDTFFFARHCCYLNIIIEKKNTSYEPNVFQIMNEKNNGSALVRFTMGINAKIIHKILTMKRTIISESEIKKKYKAGAHNERTE